MGSLASALPNYRPNTNIPVGSTVQRLSPGALPLQSQNHPIQQQSQTSPPMHQYNGQSMNAPPSNPGYPPHFMSPLHNPQQGGPAPAPFLLHQSASRAGMSSPLPQHFGNQGFLQGQQAASSQYMYYPPVYGNLNSSQVFQGSFGILSRVKKEMK